ncbi:MAG: amidohydrolase family protein, partial [Planctomycetota bacterium]|nr:amidohydrolase family protein [Planctomycetota bacterium]
MTLCIRADRVLPDTETEFAPGAVVVAGAHIAWVGPAADAPDADETVDLGAATLTPGLVNAHVHLDLSHLRGRLPYRGDFAQWIDGVRGARAEAGVAAAAAQLLDDAVKRGTTTFGDIVAPESFDAMVSVWAAAGVRARLFVEALGFRPEVADHVFAEVWELVEMRELPETLRTGISPHAPYSVSRELLAQLVAVADGHGRPLAIHVGETLEELAFIRHGIGPLRE